MLFPRRTAFSPGDRRWLGFIEKVWIPIDNSEVLSKLKLYLALVRARNPG